MPRKPLKDQTHEYRLGYMKGFAPPLVREKWNDEQRKQFERGRRAFARQRRKSDAKTALGYIVGIPAAIIGVLGTVVGLALVSALPFILVLVAAKLLGLF